MMLEKEAHLAGLEDQEAAISEEVQICILQPH
jgi:hypothetical protein